MNYLVMKRGYKYDGDDDDDEDGEDEDNDDDHCQPLSGIVNSVILYFGSADQRLFLAKSHSKNIRIEMPTFI